MTTYYGVKIFRADAILALVVGDVDSSVIDKLEEPKNQELLDLVFGRNWYYDYSWAD